MMAWHVTTAPSLEPVSLAEAKLHLRVDDTDDDALITSLITTAREWCEYFQNRAYITQTITLTLDEFPVTIIVPHPPLQSVTSVKYIDTDGVQQTLNSSVYDVDIESEPGRIVEAYSQNWPSIRGDINSIEVIYDAGYGDAGTDVPERVRAAIKLIVAHLYEHREELSEISLTTMPFAARTLLSLDRVQMV